MQGGIDSRSFLPMVKVIMSIPMSRVSTSVLVRELQVLDSLLQKGTDHARQEGCEESELIGSRLTPDMFSLVGRVQYETDTARLSGEYLSGVEAPRFEPNEISFAQLRDRVACTIAYLRSLDSAKSENSGTAP